jgi:PIN domain nuclease of toxin-antitoxin system
MSNVVLDASAVLALLAREPGADVLTPELLSVAASSTVNLAEVQGKLVDRGMNPDEAWEATLSSGAEVMSFTREHARIAGDLVRQGRPHGLSLGDRACLSLGIALGAPVYTTDKSWKKLKVSVPIHVIR